MTTIHVQLIGDTAMLPHNELERLVELARRSEEIELQMHEDDVPTWNLMRLAEQSGAFDFWKEEGEDIYSLDEREPVSNRYHTQSRSSLSSRQSWSA